MPKRTPVGGYMIVRRDPDPVPSALVKRHLSDQVKDVLSHFFEDINGIRTYDDKVSVVDIITAITEMKNPHSWLSRQSLSFETHKFDGSGQRETPVIPICDIYKLVKLIIANCKLSRLQINCWCVKLGCDHSDLIAYKKTPVELDTLDIIKAAFKNYTCIKQFTIDKYRIDLYIQEINVAIECDEYGHRHYNNQTEDSRRTVIESALNCTWVRYNPHQLSFNIGNVIYEIQQIANSRCMVNT